MARPREFDTDETLARAMDVFWKGGYGETKLPDLLKGMRLTRGSLYKAFKDKKSLFLLVLRNYDEEAVTGAVTLLTDSSRNGWERIFAVFDSITETVARGDRRGCLLCSAIAGPASYDNDIAAFAKASLDRMRVAFVQALRDTHHADQAESIAQLLVAQYVGLRILSRSNVSAETIRQNVAAMKFLAKES